MQTIRRFSNSAEASFCCSVLEAAGIEAVLADENAFNLGPQFAPWGIRLQVREESAEEAKAILDRQEGFEPLPDDFVPPPAPAEVEAVRSRSMSAGKAFIVGGMWAVIIVAAVLILARATGGHVYADGGGLFLVFSVGGAIGLTMRAIYRSGQRDALKSRD